MLNRRWHSLLHLLHVMLLAMVTGVCAPAAGSEPGVQPEASAVASHITKELPESRLAGTGLFTYFGLPIYDARLWVGPGGYRVFAPTADKFALELCYRRSLPGKNIAAASVDQMKKLGRGSPAIRAQWQAKMERIFPDVRSGVCLTGVYLPQQGVRFYQNNLLLAELLDPDFAAAFFAIWLDPQTSAPALRASLLAHAAPPA